MELLIILQQRKFLINHFFNVMIYVQVGAEELASMLQESLEWATILHIDMGLCHIGTFFMKVC